MYDDCVPNILRVDLTTGEINTHRVDRKLAKKYVGGGGLAAKILWDETTRETQPFSPENLLIFATGPLTGTAVPSSGRHIVAGISPLTGIYGQAHAGGRWGDELRHAGWDVVVVAGQSKKPIYLWLHDGKVELRDADHLWGRDTYAVDELLRKETDPGASVTTIGVAGERLARIACIMNDGKEGRAAARCGLGAVMGYKRLKAIVVRGTLPVAVHDQDALKERIAKIYAASPPPRKDDRQLVEYEVDQFKRILQRGGPPVKNWARGDFEAAYRIPEALREVAPLHCKRCPYSCSESKWTRQGERHMVWEHWGPMGVGCLIDDVAALQEAYGLCNRYGLDTISTGGTISFAMECYEKGLITRSDTQGLDLTWGNSAAMLEMVRRIGEREGVGELLGEGVRLAAERIGGLAPEYAIHAKGLEFPAHDPRAANGIAVQYATGSIGATHFEASCSMLAETYVYDYDGDAARLRCLRELGYPRQLDRYATSGKGELTARTQNYGSLLNSLVVCTKLAARRVLASDFVAMLNSVTGWSYDFDEFMQTGERIFTLKRMFNVRRGVSRKDDTLPPRILAHQRGEGGAPDNLPHLGAMLNEYYRFRGWSEEGIPTKEKLLELGLEECL